MKQKRKRGEQPTLKRRWLESSQEEAGRSSPRTVRRQEKRLGKILDGRRRSGSGSNKLAPGDAIGTRGLGEAKQTAAKSISIKRAWLAKIEAEAMGEGLVPVFHFEFIGADGDPECRHMTPGWGVVPDWFLKRLLETYEAYHGRDEGVGSPE
jgi:hypothetical protein